MSHRRVASGVPGPRTRLFPLAPSFRFRLENRGSSEEGGEGIVDPKPACRPHFKDMCIEA